MGYVYRGPNSKTETDTAFSKMFAHVSKLNDDFKQIVDGLNLPEINWRTGSFLQWHEENVVVIETYSQKQYVTQPTQGKNVLDSLLCHSMTHTVIRFGKVFSLLANPHTKYSVNNIRRE